MASRSHGSTCIRMIAINLGGVHPPRAAAARTTGLARLFPKAVEWVNPPHRTPRPTVKRATNQPGKNLRAIASAVVDVVSAITSEGALVVIVDDARSVDYLFARAISRARDLAGRFAACS